MSAGASAQPAAAQEPPGESIVDVEFLDALEAAGLTEQWFATSPFGPAATRLRITTSTEVDRVRADLLDELERQASTVPGPGLEGQIDELQVAVETLRSAVTDLRAYRLDAEEPIGAAEATRLRRVLLRSRSEVALAELAEPERMLAVLRQRVRVELAKATSGIEARQSPDLTALSLLGQDIDDVERQLDWARRAVREVVKEPDVDIEGLMAELHQARQASTGPIDDLPMVTIDAYLTGADHGIEGCSVDWRILVGIGRIESIHGTLGGASVDSAGNVSPSVFGPLLDGGASESGVDAAAEAERIEQERLAAEAAAVAAAKAAAEAEADERIRDLYGEPTPTPTPTPLFESTVDPEPDDQERNSNDSDGTDGEDEADGEDEEETGNGFAVIADTDGGALDGNADWDRAVGPMQFIPSTWRLWATDGDGDGTTDPHNFYDATRSAAAYLCHLERRNRAGPGVYLFGYNDSTSYVDDVMETAARLERLETP